VYISLSVISMIMLHFKCTMPKVVRVLMHSARAEGEWTMCQYPDYYFGIGTRKM
jgi:hypothetical protein